MSQFKLTEARISIWHVIIASAISGLALCGATIPVHATEIHGTFSGPITRILGTNDIFGPTPSDLIGTTLYGTFKYDTSAFPAVQCPGFNSPNLLCFNEGFEPAIWASISLTINGQTVTVAQSSDVNSISGGNIAMGDDVLGVVPGFPSASGDLFTLSTFTTTLVGSVNYSPGPGVDFISGIDPTQTFSSNAPSFLDSESHVGVGAIVDYKITSIRTFVTPVFEPVTIDIKPGSDSNCLNINGHGVIPVAILGSSEFDVTLIDQTTLSFAGLEVREKKNLGLLCHLKDTNIDGYWDLICRFDDDPAKWMPDSDTEATLTGNLLDGSAFQGTDSFCLRPGNNAEKLEETIEPEQAIEIQSTTEQDNLNPLPWWAW